jgi:hypothetical protein
MMLEDFAIPCAALIIIIAFWDAYDKVKKTQKLIKEAEKIVAESRHCSQGDVSTNLDWGYPL